MLVNPGTGATTLRVALSPHADTVASVSDAVTAEARRRIDPELLADVALVTSELVTNAVRHGAPQAVIDVEVTVTSSRFVLSVANDVGTTRPPDLRNWVIAGPASRRGRGLGIVRRLAPAIDVDTDEGRVVIRTAWPIA